MKVREIIKSLGIKENDIEDVRGNLDEEIENGYEIEKRNIRTGNMVQCIKIQPNIHWTDGSYRPAYGSTVYNTSVYLNKRI